MMYSYLPYATPAANYTLSVTPHNVLTEEGTRKTLIQETDAGAKEGILLSGNTVFRVTLEWNNISEADSATIMDFWLHTSKGSFGVNTFKWAHPTDNHTYIVRFDGPPKRSIRPGGLHDVQSVTLLVEAYFS